MAHKPLSYATCLRMSVFMKMMLSLTLMAAAPLTQATTGNHPTPATTVLSYCASLNEDASLATQPSQKRAQLTCMLERAKDYQQKSVNPYQRYWAYKAEAWLNYAIHKHSLDSHALEGNQAMQAADTILQALNSGTESDLNLIPDIPATSALMRPDLWATLNALKVSGGIEIAPRKLAFSEVALVWAAADQCRWRNPQSGVHFRSVDRSLEQAREAYVSAHDDKTNVALEKLINTYYKQYAALDAAEDTCHGQVWPPLAPIS